MEDKNGKKKNKMTCSKCGKDIYVNENYSEIEKPFCKNCNESANQNYNTNYSKEDKSFDDLVTKPNLFLRTLLIGLAVISIPVLFFTVLFINEAIPVFGDFFKKMPQEEIEKIVRELPETLREEEEKLSNIKKQDYNKKEVLIGGRSKEQIMKVIMENFGEMRYQYNKRLQSEPELHGKIKTKFAVDENGKVIFCEIIESDLGDPYFEAKVTSMIKKWKFEKIDKPGDVTEVIYPFIFSQ